MTDTSAPSRPIDLCDGQPPPIYRHAPGEHGMPPDLINPPFDAQPEDICGPADESQDVELYDGTLGVTRQFVDLHEPAVGQTRWNSDIATKFAGPGRNPGNVNGVRFCSGTLIAEDLFLTAAHCFEPSDRWQFPSVNGQRVSAAEAAKLQSVEFNFQRGPSGRLRQVSSFAITELVEYRRGGLDFAIVRLAGSPGRQFGWGVVSARDPAIGEMLTIIGHPAGLPKRIEAGPLTSVNGNLLVYNSIDTQGGNSGSAVLGADGLIKGVHTNGGCSMTPTPGVGNLGQRIERLIAESPVLQGIACEPYGATSIASLHWVHTPMAGGQTLYTITGNAIVHLKGDSRNFRQLGVCINVPIPDLPNNATMQLVHWAPSMALGAISNNGRAVDEGYAVDSFGIASRPGRRLTSVDLLARVAVRDTDGYLLRVPFRLTLSGLVG